MTTPFVLEMVNVGVVISYSVDSDKDFDEVDVNYTGLYGWMTVFSTHQQDENCKVNDFESYKSVDF